MTSDITPHSAPKSVMQLWIDGIRLDRAPGEFGVTPELSKIRRKVRANTHATAAAGRKNLLKIGNGWAAFHDAVQPTIASLTESTHLRIAKGDRVIERLRSGDLIALAFPVHEADASIPAIIPMFMLQQEFVNWHERRIVGHGRTYADVKISTFEPLSAVRERQPLAKRGPKPLDPLFAEALAELRESDCDFDNRLLEKRVGDLRRKVAQLNPVRFPKNAQPGRSTAWRYLKMVSRAA